MLRHLQVANQKQSAKTESHELKLHTDLGENKEVFHGGHDFDTTFVVFTPCDVTCRLHMHLLKKPFEILILID